MFDLDKLIAQMEADLAALRRAREIGRRHEAEGAPSPGNGARTAVGDAATWHAAVSELLAQGPLTCKQIQSGLAGRGFDLGYSTLYSWLVRSPEAKGKLQRVEDNRYALK